MDEFVALLELLGFAKSGDTAGNSAFLSYYKSPARVSFYDNDWGTPCVIWFNYHLADFRGSVTSGYKYFKENYDG